MDITAAVTPSAGGGFEVQQVQIDGPREDEVLVRVHAAGVCHTDLICADGAFPAPMPGVFGHEGAGVIEEIGPGVRGFAPGDRVIMSFDSCGECKICRRGMPAYCDAFMTLNFGGGRADGTSSLNSAGSKVASHFFGQSSLATYAVARARTLVKIADDIPFEVAAPLGCGVQTGAGAVLNVLKVQPGTTIAVMGTGGVGLGAIMATQLCGAGVAVAIDPVDTRRKLALELGADIALDPMAEDFADQLAQIGGLDYVVDTSGQPAVITAGFEALRKRGALALIGGPATPTFEFGSYALLDGRSVRGLTMGEAVPQQFVPMLIDHWRKGRFPVDRIVSTYPLAEVAEAIAAMRRHEIIKPVLAMT